MAFRDYFRGERSRDEEERYRDRLRSMAGGWRDRAEDWRSRGSDDDRGYDEREDRQYGARREWPPGSELTEERAESFGGRDRSPEERWRDPGQGFGRAGQYGASYGEGYRQGYGRGYGDEYERRYRPQAGGGGWRTRDEDRNFGGDYGNRGAGSSSYGRYYPRGGYSRYESAGASYGEGGYGRDMDYGRRGALGYGGYGGVGGAETGTGALPWGQETGGQHRGKGPRGYRRSDDRVRDDVCESLTDDPHVDASNLEVSVKDCEVTLSGTVASREEKRRAEVLAERIRGVKDVHNQLRVAEPGAGEHMASPSARH